MTEDAIRARINDLQNNFEQAMANANAIQGAIKDCQYWLARITETEEEQGG